MNILRQSYLILTLLLIPLFSGCGDDPSFSLSSVDKQFKLDKPTNQQISKIDILWVVDNSGSMGGTQQNLATNFKSFINSFSKQNLDFQIGVISTDSFRNNPNYSEVVKSQNARLRDGAWSTKKSGVYIIKPNTPNLESTFVKNAKLGVLGFGDERAFSSIEAAFNEPFNKPFFRNDSFIAIIMVSDEDDYSYDGTKQYDSIKNDQPQLYPVSKFTDFLDIKTESTGKRRYNISSIHIQPGDSDCYRQLKRGDQKYGERYEQIVEKTDGLSISICSDFSKSLNDLSQAIIEASLTDTFFLGRRPIVNTISVKVNGNDSPRSINGSAGWTYVNPESGKYAIRFTEDAKPSSGAIVDIKFDPYQFD